MNDPESPSAPREQSRIPKFTGADSLKMSPVVFSNRDEGDLLLDTENIFYEYAKTESETVLNALDGMHAWVRGTAGNVRQIRSYGVTGVRGPSAIAAALAWRWSGDPDATGFGHYREQFFTVRETSPLVPDLLLPPEVPTLIIEVNGREHEAERRLISDARATIEHSAHARVMLLGSADHEMCYFADRLAEDGTVEPLVVLKSTRRRMRKDFGAGKKYSHVPRTSVKVISDLAADASSIRRNRSREARREDQAKRSLEIARARAALTAQTVAKAQEQVAQTTGIDVAEIDSRLEAMADVDWRVVAERLPGSDAWRAGFGTGEWIRSAAGEYESVLGASAIAVLEEPLDPPAEAQKWIGYLLVAVLKRDVPVAGHEHVDDRIMNASADSPLAVYKVGLAQWRSRNLFGPPNPTRIPDGGARTTH